MTCGAGSASSLPVRKRSAGSWAPTPVSPSCRVRNWRLSMSRAQMAYYMLARGGVPETRFESIEGRADRDPKIPSDPNAAENRRIEILIKPPKT